MPLPTSSPRRSQQQLIDQPKARSSSEVSPLTSKIETKNIMHQQNEPIPIPQASNSVNNNSTILSSLSSHLDVLRGNSLSSVASNDSSTALGRNNSVDSTRSTDDFSSKFSELKTNDENNSSGESSNIFSSTGKKLLRKLSSSDNLSDSNGSEGGSGTAVGVNRRKSISGILSNVTKLSVKKQLPLDAQIESEHAMVKPEDLSLDFSSPLDIKSIPRVLVADPGLEMVRVTHRKKIKRCFKIDLNKNILYWNNKASSYLYIDKIKNIRTGEDARNYREEFKVSSSYESLWITIIYHNHEKLNNIKALHLIAIRKEDYDIFLNTLRNLVLFRRELTRNLGIDTNSDLSTVLHWNNSTTRNNSSKERDELTFEGVMKLAVRLHIHVNQTYLRSLFQKVDNGNKNYLTFEEFKVFVSLLRARNEVQDIFNSLCKDLEKGLSYTEFYDFLKNEQNERIEEEAVAKSIFKKFANSEEHIQLSGFSDFLISSYTVPLKRFQGDFSRPLNEYFISSSHNTYLLGKQVNGISSIEGYVKALQRGCRCIEIDIWDGDHEPIVTHGRTFTTSIGLRQVAEAIRKYAFITSPYPLILSLEIRCSIETQLMVVDILKELLSGMLVDHDIFGNSASLPTPEDLKHKVLIKVKKNSSRAADPMQLNSDPSLSSSDISGFSSSSFSEDNLALKPTTSIGGSLAAVPKKFLSRKKGSSKSTIAPQLAELGIYLVGVKFRNFSLPESKIFNHVFSFSEKTLKKMTKDEVKFKSVLKHNNRFLMRIYPSIYRFNSENFNPLPFWELGTQMVATNWQVFDLGQQLNEAMFAVGNNCGYVLKPKIQLADKISFKKKIYKSLTNYNVFGSLSIKIISAQQLTKPKDLKHEMFDPYVELEVYGAYATDVSIGEKEGSTVGGSYIIHGQSRNADENGNSEDDLNFTLGEDSEEESAVSQQKDPALAKFNNSDKYPSVTFRTSKISKNGFNPIWNQRCKASLQSNENGLIFLRFVVKCGTSKPVAPVVPSSPTVPTAATSDAKTSISSSPIADNDTNKALPATGNPSDTTVGVYCCKLDYLKKGYRHLPLYDLQGEEYIFSTLFVHIDYEISDII